MNREIRRSGRPAFLIFPIFLFFLCGCERGCARSWLESHGAGDPGAAPVGGRAVNAIDCPDGLARCTDGIVEVSRLTTIQQPCVGTQGCTCPWDRAGDCDRGCVLEGATLMVDRPRALGQLCAPAPDAGPRVVPVLEPAECDEGQLYRCAEGRVVSCVQHAIVGRCEQGCATEGGDIGDDVAVDREAAFALLCSR